MTRFASHVFAIGAALMLALAAHQAAAQTLSQTEQTSQTLAETHWIGRVVWDDHTAPSGDDWTLYFRSDGVLVYGAAGASHEDGGWHQRAGLVTFDAGDLSSVGSVHDEVIEGVAYNQDGQRGTWSFHRDTAQAYPCPNNMVALRGTTAPLVCICPPNVAITTVWGESSFYTDDSDICTAAVHAGIVTARDGGRIAVTPREGQASYRGSTAHGVATLPYGSWTGSFTVTDAGAEKK